jgi:hypothetical protein
VVTIGVVALGVTDVRRAAEFLHVADAAEQAAEAERLVSLGAERVDWDSYPDDPDFVVLADPDGNRFCIVDLSHDHPH